MYLPYTSNCNAIIEKMAQGELFNFFNFAALEIRIALQCNLQFTTNKNVDSQTFGQWPRGKQFHDSLFKQLFFRQKFGHRSDTKAFADDNKLEINH